MNDGDVRLRLINTKGTKIIREWTADIPVDDRDALAGEFLTAVRVETRTRSDDEAAAFLPDFQLQHYARVGGWTRFKEKR